MAESFFADQCECLVMLWKSASVTETVAIVPFFSAGFQPRVEWLPLVATEAGEWLSQFWYALSVLELWDGWLTVTLAPESGGQTLTVGIW